MYTQTAEEQRHVLKLAISSPGHVPEPYRRIFRGSKLDPLRRTGNCRSRV